MNTLIIPACYFGPVELYRVIAHADRVIVDLGEHYVKQSYRTQTHIAAANGAERLSVRIQRTHVKTPVREMHVSYSEHWVEQHWHAIRSAYGQSAWFIHYEDDVRSVVLDRNTSLSERNLNSMRLMLRLCKLEQTLEVSNEYVEMANTLDLRGILHPKKDLPASLLSRSTYRQVFEEKHGFIPRMSILDLLMNMGPEAHTVLRS